MKNQSAEFVENSGSLTHIHSLDWRYVYNVSYLRFLKYMIAWIWQLFSRDRETEIYIKSLTFSID